MNGRCRRITHQARLTWQRQREAEAMGGAGEAAYDEKKAPAEARYLGEGVNDIAPPDNKRSVRRQYLSKRLHAAGSRPVLEALIAVDRGQPLDDVLEELRSGSEQLLFPPRRQLLCPDTRHHYEV